MTASLLLTLIGCTGETAAPALPPLPPRVVAPTLSAPGEVRPVRELVIALTGEVRGEIEACGCPTVPYGGFARRAVFLDSLREEGVPLFVLDAGEMLVRGRTSIKAPDRVERARAVLDLSLATGLDAWAPAPLDLVAGGVDLLKNRSALSSTWRSAGSPIFPAAQVIERGGVRLGVVGVSARAPDLDYADPVAAVRAAIAGASADTWVVLTNDAASAATIAETVPGIGAVLSTRGGALDAPKATAGAPVIETPDRGRYVSVLRVALASEGGAWELAAPDPLEAVARERQRLVQVRKAAQDPAGGARVDTGRLTTLLAERNARIAGHDLVRLEEEPLGSELDAPSAVDHRIDGFKSRLTHDAQARSATRPSGYVTAATCMNCHVHSERFTAWTFDPHARAYEPLIARQQDLEVECVACHTTGWGEPGGNGTLTREAMRTWKAVQCEACHGPLAGHPNGGVKATIPTEETCVRCHDAANSPQFDYAAYRARLSCTRVSRGDIDE